MQTKIHHRQYMPRTRGNASTGRGCKSSTPVCSRYAPLQVNKHNNQLDSFPKHESFHGKTLRGTGNTLN